METYHTLPWEVLKTVTKHFLVLQKLRIPLPFHLAYEGYCNVQANSVF